MSERSFWLMMSQWDKSGRQAQLPGIHKQWRGCFIASATDDEASSDPTVVLFADRGWDRLHHQKLS
jgi:hypothetical protein